MSKEMMRTLRFHEYGEPADVLRLDEAAVPVPGEGNIVVHVHACGLNPADWALCRGFSVRRLPCGVGLDVSGVVVAVGAGVSGVKPGDAVFGPADFTHYPTAGAADYAVLYHWNRLPGGMSHVQAGALPMVIETAARYIAWSGLEKGQTVLVNGGGTMVGFAAVQMAILDGAHVIATAGPTFADRLREMGVHVIAHGDNMVQRFQAQFKSRPDVVVDAAPVNLHAGSISKLSELVDIAGGDAKRVITVADFAGAAKTGVRTGAENVQAEGGFKLRWDVLEKFGALVAKGEFFVPVAQTFRLEDWRSALEISAAGRARGKLVLTLVP